MKDKLFKTSITLPDGTRKYIRSTSKEELERKKSDLLLQIGAGLDVRDNSTFAEYAETWVRIYKRPYLRKNSIEAIENALKNHIYPSIGMSKLKKITPIQIQSLLGEMSGQSKSLNNKVIQVLRGVFNSAVDNHLIEKSPIPLTLRAGGIATKEKTALTVMQSKQLLDAVCGTRAYLFCLIALQTGMRRGEICGLMWSDIDLESGIIHVCHNAIFTNGQTYVSEALKTSAAVRDIPIPPMLLQTLRSEYKADNRYVLQMENGLPLSRRSFSNLWHMITRRTVADAELVGSKARNSKMVRGIDFHVTPHQLRHTYITRLFENGLDIKEIQYLAGHANVDMTLRIYTHYMKESRREETAQKIRNAFS